MAFVPIELSHMVQEGFLEKKLVHPPPDVYEILTIPKFPKEVFRTAGGVLFTSTLPCNYDDQPGLLDLSMPDENNRIWLKNGSEEKTLRFGLEAHPDRTIIHLGKRGLEYLFIDGCIFGKGLPSKVPVLGYFTVESNTIDEADQLRKVSLLPGIIVVGQEDSEASGSKYNAGKILRQLLGSRCKKFGRQKD